VGAGEKMGSGWRGPFTWRHADAVQWWRDENANKAASYNRARRVKHEPLEERGASRPATDSCSACAGLQSVGAHCLRASATSSHVAIAKITAKKHRMTAIPPNTRKHKVATTPKNPL
jgi:hypothetical protein